ncbi:MAG: hypothetical protein JWP39_3060 [Jatrophihabitans sp.]|jgi:cell division septal protein FtsQ|nr:hypothetical protein [Jatrophihabitans sp.]
MSAAHRRRPTPQDELRADRRAERLLVWKGLLALLLVVLVAWVRHRYLL